MLVYFLHEKEKAWNPRSVRKTYCIWWNVKHKIILFKLLSLKLQTYIKENCLNLLLITKLFFLASTDLRPIKQSFKHYLGNAQMSQVMLKICSSLLFKSALIFLNVIVIRFGGPFHKATSEFKTLFQCDLSFHINTFEECSVLIRKSYLNKCSILKKSTSK